MYLYSMLKNVILVHEHFWWSMVLSNIICTLFTSIMLFTKRCQDYYYPISYIISMAIYNAKRFALALFINSATFWLLPNNTMMLTPMVVYGIIYMVQFACKSHVTRCNCLSITRNN